MRKKLLLVTASLLAFGLFGCKDSSSSQITTEDPSEVSTTTEQPQGENLVLNGDMEPFRERICTDAEKAVRELGTSWATDYGLGTYTGAGENVAKVTMVDGDPCIKLDGRGGSSNIWIWAGGSELDTYMYMPLGASPAGEYLIDVDLKYDVAGVTDPTMDALATEFLGGPAQSMIQITEYAEYAALPASTVRGEGWKHAQFTLSKMQDNDGNGWFNLYVIPGERGGVLYADNIQVRYNDEDPKYANSYLVDINDGDKGQFSSYYKVMLTNNPEENVGYYTIGTEDAKGKAVILGDKVAMKLSYEGHGQQASFAKNINLQTAVGKTVKVEFDAKLENLGDNSVKFSFANDTKELTKVAIKAADGTASALEGFKHFSFEVEMGSDIMTRIQFALDTGKVLSKTFALTNLSVTVL